MIRVTLAMLLLAGAPASAQTPPASVAAAAPVDPARLAAARDLMDTLMPTATRARIIDEMVRPMMANIQRAITQDPDFVKSFNDDPRARDLFKQFMTLTTLNAAMPGMWEATARAYARRFDVAQMDEIKRFFATPTGHLYMQQSLTIMSDPDIAAWQSEMMQRSLRTVQADVADLARQIAALHGDKHG